MSALVFLASGFEVIEAVTIIEAVHKVHQGVYAVV
jgi:hypothetical protein